MTSPKAFTTRVLTTTPPLITRLPRLAVPPRDDDIYSVSNPEAMSFSCSLAVDGPRCLLPDCCCPHGYGKGLKMDTKLAVFVAPASVTYGTGWKVFRLLVLHLMVSGLQKRPLFASRLKLTLPIPDCLRGLICKTKSLCRFVFFPALYL